MTREEAKAFLASVRPVLSAKMQLAIKALEQEPKTGHWIYIRNSEVNGLKIVECSECGKRTYGSGNYCPNCGVKMVEPQESEVGENDRTNNKTRNRVPR